MEFYGKLSAANCEMWSTRDRYFNILSQAKRYDPHGKYVKLWIPELSDLPPSKIHRPDMLSSEEQETFHVTLGADFPKAMVSTERWA